MKEQRGLLKIKEPERPPQWTLRSARPRPLQPGACVCELYKKAGGRLGEGCGRDHHPLKKEEGVLLCGLHLGCCCTISSQRYTGCVAQGHEGTHTPQRKLLYDGLRVMRNNSHQVLSNQHRDANIGDKL